MDVRGVLKSLIITVLSLLTFAFRCSNVRCIDTHDRYSPLLDPVITAQHLLCLATTFALTSVWSDVCVATSGVFSTTVFVACLSPTLHVQGVGVSGSGVSPPQAAQRWVFFYIHSFSRCLLTGAFRPFTVKGIIDKNLLPFC